MKKFDHFKSNLKILEKADKEDLTNEFILGGIIDKFFIQFELGWKVLKELLTYEGQAVAAYNSPYQLFLYLFPEAFFFYCTKSLARRLVLST